MCSSALPTPACVITSFPQTRMPDMVLGNAQEIQAERAMPGQKVVWLLVTDNEQIRHAAAQHFPDLVLTNLER